MTTKANTCLPLNQIVYGDCIDVMKRFPEASIDCIVTDPPYGIGFMGKNWDKALPKKEAFQQMYRVLKPGALAFVMSSPRQDVLWRMMQMLEECGFQLRQSFISWIYKSGFPKAYDVSLGIDKKFIREEFIAEYGRKPTREELKTLLKEKRKLIGVKIRGDVEKAKNTGVTFARAEANKNNKAIFGYGIEEITEPASDLAKKWNGWKSITGLKPALECVLMVNKPFTEKTIVDNVLRHGTGAINVDACRIPFDSSNTPQSRAKGYPFLEPTKGWNQNDLVKTEYKPNIQGRFPANLLVSDGALDTGKITKNPQSYRRKAQGYNVTAYGKGMGEPRGKLSLNYGDVGDQSRYFDLDAWAEHYGFLDVPKASKSEREKGLHGLKEQDMRYQDGRPNSLECFEIEGCGRKTKTKAKNFHPTVKPVKLMAYLIELGCPKDGVILDPFVGSGTTCLSANLLGRDFIGIELKPEYVKIARRRLSAVPVKLEMFEA